MQYHDDLQSETHVRFTIMKLKLHAIEANSLGFKASNKYTSSTAVYPS